MLLRLSASPSDKGSVASTLLSIALLLLSSGTSQAQTTVATGSIQGSVTDPSSAVVTGAKITITNKATGQELTTTTTSSGTYSSGSQVTVTNESTQVSQTTTTSSAGTYNFPSVLP